MSKACRSSAPSFWSAVFMRHSSTVILAASRAKQSLPAPPGVLREDRTRLRPGWRPLDSPANADYDELVKIRIGHLSTFYHTAVLLMARQDLTARLGADIEWQLFGTGPAIMKAFARGALDLAYIGLPPAIIGMEKGIDVVCIAGGHMEGTVMAGKAQWQGFPELQDPGAVLRQFAGKKIGVPGPVPSMTSF